MSTDRLGLGLRTATAADSARLLSWRNDPAMRRAARRTGVIAVAQHERWLAQVLPDPDRHLLIGELEGEPVGQVRFDRIGDRAYEVGITIDPVKRGAGLGGGLLLAGLGWLWSNRDAERVEAAVRAWNRASLATFRSAGFRPIAGAEPGFVRLVVRPDGR